MAGPSHPWWIALPFGAAVALMSAFAPGIIPDWAQAGLFALGLVLTIVSAVGALWHYRIAWGRRVVGAALVIVLGIALVAAGAASFYIGFKQLQNRALDSQESLQSTELSGLTNSQLRALTVETSKSLRIKENKRTNSRPNLGLEFRSLPHDKKRELWISMAADERKKDDEYREDFHNNYRASLLALRAELRIRLKKAGSYKDDDQYNPNSFSFGASDRVLDMGSVDGAYALTDIADMFEAMARALP